MERVIVESPYAGDENQINVNVAYCQFVMHDCLVNHNEAPYASHILYTQENILRDEIPEDRKLGIDAGFEWRWVAEKTVFYTDLGMTKGMKLGIEDCKKKNKPYEVRQLPDYLWKRFIGFCLVNGYDIDIDIKREEIK